MKRSTARILTTHVGALPGPMQGTQDTLPDDELRTAVRDVVRKQRDTGVDFVNEGELTKGGNFVTFINPRLSGFEPSDAAAMGAVLTASQDWTEFSDFYNKALTRGTLFEQTGAVPDQAPSRRMAHMGGRRRKYVAQETLQREINTLRDALDGH